MNLNENQAAAVAWNEGPLLVLAGPGSGKTAVLTRRATRLLQEDPEAGVLALTFTTKAATEMRERVDALMGQHADRAHLSTFHSFATEILRQHGSHIGLKPDFTLLTLEEDRIAILNDVISTMTTGNDVIPVDRKSILTLFDRLFAESYDGNGVTGLLHTPDWLSPMFQAYCAHLVRANRLDFGTLLHFARQLLQARPAVVRLLRLSWRYICIDEFQDTNKAQYDLLRLFIDKKNPNLFVVADDDQIIYQWNGASPERLQLLQRDFQMAVLQLPENYRCPPAVVQLANALIAHNLDRTPGKKPLVAHQSTDSKGVIVCGAANTPEEEAQLIANSISTRKLAPGDCAVLARTTRLLHCIEKAIQEQGYKTYHPQRKTEFDSPPVALQYSVLRLANARHDREMLRRVCVAWQQVTEQLVEVEDIVAAAALKGGDFVRAWVEHVAQAPHALGDWLIRIQNLLVDRLDFIGLIDVFLLSGLPGWEEDPDTLDERQIWKQLHDEILREYGSENTTLFLYLQEMDLRSKTPLAPPDAIRLMTIHGSKGLEFKHVFLAGMAEGQFPSFQAVKKGESSKEMEEERRNCFVAITRVQETLRLSRSTQYNGWKKAPSRFLQEMGLKVEP